MNYEVYVTKEIGTAKETVLVKKFTDERDAKTFMLQIEAALDAAMCIVEDESPELIKVRNGDAYVNISLVHNV